MRVEIIENHANHLGLRIALVDQPLHLLGKVLLGASLRHGDMPPPRLRLTANKQIASALALILVIFSLRAAGTHR